LNRPSLSFGITPADSEVFPSCSASAAVTRLRFILPEPFALFRRLFRRTPFPGSRSLQANVKPWELASLGFPSLQHLPEWGVHFSGVCLAPFVALSGFVYPLSGLLLPKPLDPLFQVQAFLGLTPSEFFPLRRAQPLSRLFAPLSFDAPNAADVHDIAWTSELFSLRRAVHSQNKLLHWFWSRSSLGVRHLWGIPPRPCQPFRADSSSVLSIRFTRKRMPVL
jgi:hypothetical protein